MRSNISFYKHLLPLLSSSSLHFQFLLSPYKLRSSLGISKPKLIIRANFQKCPLVSAARTKLVRGDLFGNPILRSLSSDIREHPPQQQGVGNRRSHLPSIFPQEDVTASRRFQCADTTIVSVWHCLYLGLELHPWNNNQR